MLDANRLAPLVVLLALAPALAQTPNRPGTDTYGDPLPPSALARIGTLRWQHESGIACVRFAPDGSCIASGGYDGTVRLWDMETGKELRQLRGHLMDIRDLAFAPDSKILASASWDTTVRLWDVASGNELHVLKGSSDAALRVAFAPDGKTLVSSDRGNSLFRWDTATGKKLYDFVGHEDCVTSLTYSADGRTLISTALDRTVRLWEVATAKQRQVIRLPDRGWVWIAPGGKVMAQDTSAQKIRLVEIASGKELCKVAGHDPFTFVGAFSLDGKTFAAGSHDRLLRLWDVASGKMLLERQLEGLVGALDFSPDGKLLASGCDTSIRFWDAGTGQEETKVKWPQAFKAVSLSPSGKLLATAGGINLVRIWDADSGKKLRTLIGHTAETLAVAFAPDGKEVASGAADGTVRLWDPLTGEERKQWTAHTGSVTCVAYTRDGKTLATGGSDKKIRLWAIATGKEVRELAGHESSIVGLVFSGVFPRRQRALFRGWTGLHRPAVGRGWRQGTAPACQAAAGGTSGRYAAAPGCACPGVVSRWQDRRRFIDQQDDPSGQRSDGRESSGIQRRRNPGGHHGPGLFARQQAARRRRLGRPGEWRRRPPCPPVRLESRQGLAPAARPYQASHGVVLCSRRSTAGVRQPGSHGAGVGSE
jgi:WD40 repeat protein